MLRRKRFSDQFVKGLLVFAYFLEILKVNFVKELDDEDDMSANYLLNCRFFEFRGIKDLLLIKGATLSYLVPNFLDVLLLPLVQASQEVIIELFVVHKLGNGVGQVLMNHLIGLEFRATDLLRNVAR